MSVRKDLRESQLTLILLWVGGVLPASLLLLADTLVRHRTDASHGWGWLLATTMPTIGLVLGAFTATPPSQQSSRSVDMPFFRVTLGMSCFYLVVVNLSILSMWLHGSYSDSVSGIMASVLGPMQGLLTAALGFFFIRLGNPEPPNEQN